MKIPQSDWVWYGFPGHFVGGNDCVYHLCTRIGTHLISTIGLWRTKEEEILSLGLGNDDIFELMIFVCDGEDENGNPVIGKEMYREHFSTSIEAEMRHREVCLISAGLKNANS